MQLTKDNYYSSEANNEYWSASLVKEFLDCPSRAIATLNGDYQREPSTALLVGSYVDSYFEGEESFKEFTETHPEIFKRDGTLKAEYVLADTMIATCEKDAEFMKYIEGEKQKIVTGKIDGFPFKAKFDIYQEGKRIVDFKTVKDFEPVYKPAQGRLTFADAWNWPLQMAIYQALEGNKLPCYLAVVTKETPPDHNIFEITQEKLDAELAYVKEKLPLWDAMRKGIVPAPKCGKCAWCRASRKVSAPELIDIEIFTGGND